MQVTLEQRERSRCLQRGQHDNHPHKMRHAAAEVVFLQIGRVGQQEQHMEHPVEREVVEEEEVADESPKLAVRPDAVEVQIQI